MGTNLTYSIYTTCDRVRLRDFVRTVTFKNELEAIKGIGKNTADNLLKEFKSVKRIRELPEDELVRAVGLSKAKMIRDHFAQAKN